MEYQNAMKDKLPQF